MKVSCLQIVVASTVLGCFAAPALAASGLEVMQQVYDQARIHAHQSATVEMRIFDAEDEQRNRWFKSKFRVLKDRSKSLIRIYKPTSQKGIGLLSETQDKKDRSDQWMFLPAFRSTRKINSESRNNSFLGSDLSVGDMAGRKPEQDRHTIISENDQYWTIESAPKKSDEAYSKFVSNIHKKVKVATKIDFYDRSGQLLKTLSNQKITNYKGMYMATEILVVNHQTNGRTELTRSNVDIKSRIGKNEVGLRGLKELD